MKVKCLILAVILLFSFTFTAMGSEGIKEKQTRNVIEFLTDLNVLENVYEVGGEITRGDFVSLAVSAMKAEVQGEIDDSFVDVDKTHKNAADIYKAKLLGVVSGAQGNRFYPDTEISYNAAIKILVSALGYKNQAEAMGGYPMGYFTVAQNISLTKGVPVKDESALNFGEASVLIYNFLNSDLCEIVEVSGENSTSKRQYGVNLLNTKYALRTIEGVIKSAGFMSATPDFYTEEPVIEIDGAVYKTDVQNAEKYIGLSVKAYVNDETLEIVAVYANTINEVVEINAEDVVSYNDFKLEVIGDNLNENDVYDFDRGFYYIKNGRASRNVEFSFEDGTVMLIDNNGDKIIDFAIAQKYDYMLVSSVSTIEDGVYDIDAGKKLYFKEDFGYHYDLVIDGENKKYDYLKQGMMLTIIKSDDNKYIKAIASSMSVLGVLSEIYDDILKIGESEYKTNKYFDENYIVSPGAECEFLLSHDGKIAALKTNTKGKMRYAYLFGYHKSANGLSSQVQIQILDQGGQHMVYSLADKVTFNGTPCNKTDSVVSDTFTNGNYPRYQVIKYSIDDDSLVNVIDTAEEISSTATAEEKYTIDFSGNNTLTRFVKNKKTYYDNSQSFLPFAAVNSETIIFSVPNSIADSVNEGKATDGRNAFYDKKFFGVFKLSSLGGRETVLCDIYDQNKYMQPGIMILYNNYSGTSASIGEGTVPRVVDRVVDAISPDGEIVKKMTVLSGSNYVSYYLSAEFCAELGSNGMPQSGDVIRMSTNSAGEVSGLVVDARFNRRTGKIEIINQADNQVYYPYYTGKMFSHGNGAMTLLVEDAPFMDAYSDVTEDGVSSFVLPSSVTYIRYNAKQNTAIPIRVADVEDVLSVGRDNASTVILQAFSHNVRVLIEYVNE